MSIIYTSLCRQKNDMCQHMLKLMPGVLCTSQIESLFWVPHLIPGAYWCRGCRNIPNFFHHCREVASSTFQKLINIEFLRPWDLSPVKERRVCCRFRFHGAHSYEGGKLAIEFRFHCRIALLKSQHTWIQYTNTLKHEYMNKIIHEFVRTIMYYYINMVIQW